MILYNARKCPHEYFLSMAMNIVSKERQLINFSLQGTILRYSAFYRYIFAALLSNITIYLYNQITVTKLIFEDVEGLEPHELCLYPQDDIN